VRLLVAGAGMAGLVAGARARELGLEPLVLEKGSRPGGSMLLSSGVVWRHHSFEDFRAECPGGDETLQRLVYDRLDDALDWLEALGAPVTEPETANPRTTGRRFDTVGLTEALGRTAGEVHLRRTVPRDPEGPFVLATGGFPAALADRLGLILRANPWSTGDGLWHARGRGAALVGDLDEFYGRNLPAPPARVTEPDFVRLAQLYGRLALVVNLNGVAFAPGEPSWSETDLVQATARQPWGRAWYVVDGRALADPGVAERIAAAEEVGGEVRRAETLDGLGLELPASDKLAEPPFAAVLVQAAVTHTMGGIRVDEQARVLRDDGTAIEGLFAAGADAGGVSTGGYSSGLAAALVLGLAAAEAAAS
jgi:succinate dehydrogenase/fumarate reductase flavoprotein subunit